MAEIIRLNSINPAINTPTSIFTSNSNYLVSVIATNTSSTGEAQLRIWVAPNNSASASLWGYIMHNVMLPPSQSVETFKFAINANDRVYVQGGHQVVSFTIQGIDQLA
jgi:hypothetical protein